MKSVLVTGGAGYIGSHACKALAQAGYEPISFDNMVYGHEWAVQWGPLVRGDTSDTSLVIKTIEKHDPVAVIHFAAFAYVGESVTNPLKYYNNNLTGTLGILNAMVETQLDKLIFSSSCATYGVPDGDSIPEDHRQTPINPYGQSKLMVERILKDVSVANGLRSVALRYFNAAGADVDAQIGESHDPETHLIPLVLDAAAGRRKVITVFGDDYTTPDGTCVRDYIHVADLAEAHVMALNYLLKDGATDAFNLGTGRGHSVAEVIEMAAQRTGRAIPVAHGPRREGDPPYLVAAPGRALQALGWKPELSGLEEIIDTAWRWHQKHYSI